MESGYVHVLAHLHPLDSTGLSLGLRRKTTLAKDESKHDCRRSRERKPSGRVHRMLVPQLDRGRAADWDSLLHKISGRRFSTCTSQLRLNDCSVGIRSIASISTG